MKQFLACGAILIFVAAAFGAEIYLKDGSVIKGKIIRITGSQVEYTVEKGRTVDSINIDRVSKIINDEGRTASFRLDTLYRKDGSTVKGTVTGVTDDDVLYNPEGSSEQKAAPRTEIDRIEYGDGKVVYIAQKKVIQQEVTFEAKKQTGGFHDSIVRIAGFFGFGNPYGGVFDKEQRVFNAYKPDLFNAYIVPRDYKLTNNLVTGGGEIDLMPPAIKFMQRRSFDFTGIKFGIRGRYAYESVDSIITEENSYYSTVESYELFRGRYMGYHYWAAGPVINLIFSPRSNMMNLLLNFYAVAGQILGGKILPAAALRSAHLLGAEFAGAFGPTYLAREYALYSMRYVNKTRFRGYTIRGGFGPHFSLNKFCPITIGLNVTYAYSNIRLGRDPFLYFDGNKKASHHEVGAELSAGFHI
jgi:hypothetical protein